MRAWFLSISMLAAGCGGHGHGVFDGPLDEPPEASQSVAAMVGDTPIYESEVEEEHRITPGPRREVLGRLIDRTLIERAAAAAGVVVPTPALEERFNAWRQRYRSTRDMEDALTTAGRTVHHVRAELLHELLLDRLLEHRGLLTIPVAAIRKRYSRDRARYDRPARVRAEHMLFAGPESTAQQRRVKVARRALARRQPFAEVARRHGDGRSSERGGALGWFAHGVMEPAFERAVFAARPGALGAVRTRQGLHLFRVLERQAASRTPFREVAPTITAALRRERRRTGRGLLLQRLRQSTRVQKTR